MKRIPLVLAALLLACTGSTEPETDRVLVLGTIAFHDLGPEITLESDGRELTVTIETYGPGCYDKGPTVANEDGMKVMIWPYNFTPLPGSGCTRDLRVFVHKETFTFDSSGPVQVIVRGLEATEDPYGDPVAIEMTAVLE